MDAAPRIEWLDMTKGAGILLVVTGHITQCPALAHGIYLFHMPLFFVLSGYLYRPTATSALLKRRFKSLLIPYFSFLIITIAGVEVEHAAFGGQLTNSFPGLLFRGLYGGQTLGSEFAAFWFVPCLVVTQATYNLLMPARHRLLGRVRWIIVAVCLAASTGIDALAAHGYSAVLGRIPFCLSVVPATMVAYWFGHLLREKDIQPSWSIRFLALATAFTALSCASMGVAFDMNMKNLVFGPPLLGLSLSLALSLFFIDAVRQAVWSRILRVTLDALGRASLTIMFLHQLAHTALIDLGMHPGIGLISMCVVLPYGCYAAASRVPVLRIILLGDGRASRAAIALRQAA